MTSRSQVGTSKKACEERKRAFALEYIRNGSNGRRAAIAVGYSPNGAEVVASRLLKDTKVRAIIRKAMERAETAMELSAERTLREIARLAFFDPARLFHADGFLKSVAEMDEDTRAALASIEVRETRVGPKVVSCTTKLRFHSKTAALDQAMKHFGLFEKDSWKRTQPDPQAKAREDETWNSVLAYLDALAVAKSTGQDRIVIDITPKKLPAKAG